MLYQSYKRICTLLSIIRNVVQDVVALKCSSIHNCFNTEEYPSNVKHGCVSIMSNNLQNISVALH